MRTTDSVNIKDEYNRLLPIHIVYQDDHLRDYSTNLFGLYNANHIYFNFNKNDKKYNGLWVDNILFKFLFYKRDYTFDYNKGYFFLKIEDFNEYVGIYNFENNGKVEIKDFKGLVIHTPTNANFWHFSIRWFMDGLDISELKPKAKRGEVKALISAAKSIIIEKSVYKISEVIPYKHVV